MTEVTATYNEKGSQGGQDLLQVLADPSQLKKKLKAFQEAEDHANNAVELAGAAGNLSDIKKSVTNEKKKLERAKDSCKKLLCEAEEKAEAILSNAKNTLKEAQEEHQSVVAIKHRLKEDSDSLEDQQKGLKKGLIKLEKERSRLNVMEQKLQEDRKILATIKSSITQALEA